MIDPLKFEQKNNVTQGIQNIISKQNVFRFKPLFVFTTTNEHIE